MIETKKFLMMEMICWFAAVILAAALIVTLTAGCNGGGSGTYQSARSDVATARLTYDPQGRPIIEYSRDGSTNTDNSVKVQSPPNAKQPTTFYTGEDGTTGGAAGQWEPAAIDYVKKNEASLIYIGAAMGIAGIVLMTWSGARAAGFAPVGVGLIIGGVVTCFLPTVIASAGPWIGGLLVIVAAGALLCGVAWLFGKRGGIKDAFDKARERGNVIAGKLAAVGRTEEAIAARRATDPSYSKAVADGKTADADPIAVADPAIKLDV